MSSGDAMPETDSHAIAFTEHDHSGCAADVMARADALAAREGLRMTPVRRRVLEILLEAHRALGAYDVLDRLAEEGHARQPPVAYRALEFLTANGLAHRVERLNAFTACMQPDAVHSPVLMICRACNAVAEAPAEPVRRALGTIAAASGFEIERTSIEAIGCCPACREAS